MTAFRVPAPAKINLVLRILGRREDGYHDLDTLFQAISLGDEVVLTSRTAPGIDLTVAGADVGPVNDNLAFRAARGWSATTGIDPRVQIRLSKRVPAGAGLGGGSSDAGAVLRGLEAMHGTPLGPEGIARIGAELGADVPFFCGTAGLARGQGIGERLTPLPAFPRRELIVAVPPVPVPTADAYAWLAATRESTGAATGTLDRVSRSDIERLSDREAAPTWQDVDRLAFNDFHSVVAGQVPEVARLIERLTSLGLEGVLLSGSGSAVFGFLPRGAEQSDSEFSLKRVRHAIPDARVFTATTLPTIPAPRPIDAESVDRP